MNIWGNARSERDLIVIASHLREADWVVHLGVAKERNSGRDCRARGGVWSFGGTTQHLNCAFTTSASGNTLENTSRFGVKGEANMSAVS